MCIYYKSILRSTFKIFSHVEQNKKPD